jgi:hypothetical protein
MVAAGLRRGMHGPAWCLFSRRAIERKPRLGRACIPDAAMKATTPKPKKTTTRRTRKTTARNIELYSSAYRTAWNRISALQKREQPNIALRLHASIRRKLKEGTKDPFLIACEALGDLQKYTVVTYKRDARVRRRKPSPQME